MLMLYVGAPCCCIQPYRFASDTRHITILLPLRLWLPLLTVTPEVDDYAAAIDITRFIASHTTPFRHYFALDAATAPLRCLRAFR